MKTPAAVARDFMEFSPNEHRDMTGIQVYTLMVRAIEADRAQREDDGTIHAAVIAALWDRAEDVEDGEQNVAASAAQWVEDEPDEFWEEFAGPMLDEIEGKFR